MYMVISSLEIQCWKIFHTIQFGEDVLKLCHGLDEFLGEFVQDSLINDKALATIALRYYYDGNWPAGVTTAYHFDV